MAIVLEEGLDADVLRGEVEAIAEAAGGAGVEVITGDTKVVERGHADEMYICTSGSAGSMSGRRSRPARWPPAIACWSRSRLASTARRSCSRGGELGLDADVVSDTRSLWPVANALLDSAGAGLRCMRDATRGGVIATVLNELARASGVGMSVREAGDPHARGRRRRGAARDRPDVRGERGVMVAFVGPGRRHRGRGAALRARMLRRRRRSAGRDEPPGMVLVETAFGGQRVMDLLAGDPLPRIC